MRREDLGQRLDAQQLVLSYALDLAWSPAVMPVFTVNAEHQWCLRTQDIDLVFVSRMPEDEVV
jgi:hypothetical protein